MSDRPIIFSEPMVNALLEGRKKQTRRVVKSPIGDMDRPFQMDDGSWHVTDSQGRNMSPINVAYSVGDRLWIREAWRATESLDHLSPKQIGEAAIAAGFHGPWCPYVTLADDLTHDWEDTAIIGPESFGYFSEVEGRYRHARFMPRWVSRLTLIVTDVRVERIQDISEADAIAEGCAAVDEFRDLWNAIQGDGAWDRNDWVVALSFDVHHKNIDEVSP